MYEKFLKCIPSVRGTKLLHVSQRCRIKILTIVQGGLVKVQAIRTVYWSGASRPVWFKKTCHF